VVAAVLWDLGGVILESPFDGFARYETEHSLPAGFIRTLNATNPDDNAWARFERGHVGVAEFATLFEAEAAAAGGRIDAAGVLALLSGRPRPEMVEALRRCAARLRTGAVTNNFVGFARPDAAPRPDLVEILALFDVVIESSKVGLRKPDPRIYELACDELGVIPTETVFLDDLGVNLKSALALGMTTIKVVDPGSALAELEAVVGFPLR
jgi:putative hydrolase of the HAD superfamily